MPSFSWNVAAPVTVPPPPSVIAPTVAQAPLGTDVSTVPDLDGYFRLMTGLRVVGEALLRRLTTPPGGLFYDPDYGYDIRGLLNAPLTSADLARARIRIVAECQKDERVDTVEADLALNESTGRLTLSLLVATAAGPFKLTAAVSAVTVELLSFTEANS